MTTQSRRSSQALGSRTTRRLGGPHLRSEAQSALSRAREHLLGLQHDDGYFWGELESNSSIAAEHVFLLNILGFDSGDDRLGLRAELLATQREDGGWANWFGGPIELSTTVEAYYALKLLGLTERDEPLRRAGALIRSLGGANRVRFFTKLWLAVLGEFPYDALPAAPPEIFLIPPRFRVAPVYRLASWARGTFVPIMIVLSRRPVYAQRETMRELFLEPPGAIPNVRAVGAWSRRLDRIDRVVRRYDHHPITPLRRLAERRIARWIVNHQEADGSWGGIQPPWVYSMIALHALGYPTEHPVMARGQAGFETFTIRRDGRTRIQACLSPVWDSALATVALADSGLKPGDRALRRAATFLLSREVKRTGDWRVLLRRGEAGGWPFEFDNECYPDTDDAAEVLLALRRAGTPADHPAVRRGVRWLLTMQSANGGWGAFDVDNLPHRFGDHPICDFGAIFDPPTEDVTAHVLEALVACSLRSDHPAVARAINFLWSAQRPDGSWWGRWGVNHIYGTGAAVPALVAAGVARNDPRLRRATAWLGSVQNRDGGWGESVRSYLEPQWIGRGESTPSQTSWALLALIAATPGHPSIAPGIEYLVRSQRPDGTWDEPQFTGTGFPNDFMINYHLYRLYFPLSALGRFLG